ncbi:MAG: hypothetical protein RI894_1286 [Bacteroidota bacterium]
MVTNINIQNLSVEVLDLLEQIHKLNERIAVKRQSEEFSMATQYEYIREQFYEKLKIALAKNFEIAAEVQHLEKVA